MHAFNTRTLLYPVFALLVAAGAMSQPAQAAGVQAKTPQALQLEAQQISQQLGRIEQKTIVGDKKLQAQGKRFSEDMIKAMQTIGYSPKADGKKMVEIQKALNSGNLSQGERAAKIQEFQGLRARMMQAQRAVMQDKSLLQERRKLSEDTMLAMKKQNPRTEKLMQRLDQIGKQLQRMAQASRSAHQ